MSAASSDVFRPPRQEILDAKRKSGTEEVTKLSRITDEFNRHGGRNVLRSVV